MSPAIATSVPNHVGIDLLHALIAHVSDEAGGRYLIIKGPTLARQGLRPARTSSDVDVLPDPHFFDELCDRLIGARWRLRPQNQFIASPHSVTLIHDSWGVDIDVHRYFPGIFQPAELAFERMWETHDVESFANRNVTVPNRDFSRLIHLLHGVRSHEGAEALRLARRSSEQFSEPEFQSLLRTARLVGADYALSEVLRAREPQFVAELDDSWADLARDWDLRRSSPDRTGKWWAAIHQVDFTSRPRLLLRAMWPSVADIEREHPGLAPTRTAYFRFRMRRLWRGLSVLPTVLVRASRRY